MIIGGDSKFPLKPDPESLIYFVKINAAVAEKSWMMGDHYTDLEAARRAGMQRCFASYGFGDCRNETYEFKVECFTDFVNLCLAGYKH
jgi:phosphoglycolate phosphatase